LNSTTNIDAALYEHRFWLQVLGDHSRFIFFSLAPSETEYLMLAQEFILLFDHLLANTDQFMKESELDSFTRKVYEAAYQLRDFKLELLSMSLTSDVKTHLPPSFYNDMLNELEEYLYIINRLQNDAPLQLHPLHYHMLWLSDAVGHAASVADSLDFAEADLVEQALRYKSQFENLYLKSLLMNGYLRTELDSFPSLTRLNELAAAIIIDFIEYLDQLRDKRTDHKVLGTLMPLMADHMSREECYYLRKLSYATPSVRRPDCDPTRPRVEV